MGTVYLRGEIYWIKYHHRGRAYYESAKTPDESEAETLLKIREGELAKGQIPTVVFNKVKFDELSDGFLADYEENDKKSLRRAKASAEHLRGFFGRWKATEITTAQVRKYIKQRKESKGKPKNATINRELAALKAMFNLAARETPPKVDKAQIPYIPTLKENNVRKGFFEHGDFLALRQELPEHLRGIATFGYKNGWRVSEITDLKWSQVDLDQGIVRLEPGETKNEEGRTVYLDDELKDIFRQQWERRKETARLLPYVFLNAKVTDRVKRFDKAWKTACKKVGLEGKLFHDLRRTAVRNMVRAGIPETVAMKISGHKTRSVFDRYNITSLDDLKLAAQRQEQYLKAQTVTKTVTMANFDKKRGLSGVS